jgi:hypothetical protein
LIPAAHHIKIHISFRKKKRARTRCPGAPTGAQTRPSRASPATSGTGPGCARTCSTRAEDRTRRSTWGGIKEEKKELKKKKRKEKKHHKIQNELARSKCMTIHVKNVKPEQKNEIKIENEENRKKKKKKKKKKNRHTYSTCGGVYAIGSDMAHLAQKSIEIHQYQ